MDNSQPLEESKPKYLSRRFVAGLIDFAKVNTIAFMLIFILATPDNKGAYPLEGLPLLLPILFWWIFMVVIQTWFGGTLGYSMVKLKPANLFR